jgi:ABC transport system ATP-binding/permease protein
MNTPLALAKLTWNLTPDETPQEFVLMEGATVTIGRQSTNDLCIPEQHVSRQHAVINYRDGVFVITDLGSANGTFVNDMQLTQPFPLASGDVIRLYVPEIHFSATVTEEDQRNATLNGTLITAVANNGQGRLIIANGPQEGHTVPLLLKKVKVGRATSKADWEIALQDPSVSRPHATLEFQNDAWVVYDMGSSNGTQVNDVVVNEKGRVLRDGDIVIFGKTRVVFRAG